MLYASLVLIGLLDAIFFGEGKPSHITISKCKAVVSCSFDIVALEDLDFGQLSLVDRISLLVLPNLKGV